MRLAQADELLTTAVQRLWDEHQQMSRLSGLLEDDEHGQLLVADELMFRARRNEGRLTFAKLNPLTPSDSSSAGGACESRQRRTHATYTPLEGDPLDITHHGTSLRIATNEPATHAIPPVVERATPSQPAGRAPSRRLNGGG